MADPAEAPDAIEPPAVSRLPLLAMGVLVAIAAAVGIALAVGGPASYDPGTPEAALQDFLEAGLDGDRDGLAALLGPAAATRCDDELDRINYRSTGLRFNLDDMRVDGDQAAATVSRRYSSGGDPFDGPGRASNETFELALSGGEWIVIDASWPWDIARCLEDQS